uniref:VENN motif pre-toxin domain-containing protein n=1 Tax=Stenotrophomonas maltophilia TaxID=40324 RepID=UPI000AAA9A8C
IESLQDIAESMSRNSQVGGRVQVSFGTAWNADGYASAGKANGSYQGVGQQSGLFAGNGGYHVDAGQVNLVGGAIASTNAGNSELTADTLTFTDLQNHMDYKASSGSISGGFGNGGKGPAGKGVGVGEQLKGIGTSIVTGKLEGPTGVSMGGGLPMHESGSDSSSTRATLTEGNITIGGRKTTAAELGVNTDAAAAHRALDAMPDANKLLVDQQAMANAASTVLATSKQVAVDVQAYQSNKATQAYYDSLSTEQKKAFNALSAEQRDAVLTANSPAYENAKKWGTGGEYNRALNAVTTALVGGVAGQGAGQVASNALAPYAAYFIGSTLDPNHGSDPNATLQLLSHAVLGALLAEANGGSAGTGAVSAAGGELAAKVLTNTLTGGDPSRLSPEQREMVLALSQAVGALAGGLSGQDLAGITLNAGIAKNSVENNFLGHVDQKRLASLREKSQKGGLTPQESTELLYLDAGDRMSDGLLNKLYAGEKLTEVQQRNLEIYLGTYAQQNGADAAAALVAGGFRKASEFPYSGLSSDKRQYADENFSAFERYIWRPQGINEAIYNEAIIKSGLQIWRSEDLLPTAMRQRHDFALLDAQIASPLASGAYLFGTAAGLSDDDRYALTMTAGNIALIAGAVAAGKTGLLPVTGRLGINPSTGAASGSRASSGSRSRDTLAGRDTTALGAAGKAGENVTERGTLVNLIPADLAVQQKPVRVLVQDDAGRYWLKTESGKLITPSGRYDFVTMPDGTIRASRPGPNQDYSTHLGLSGGGEVKYAGSIRFGNNDGPNRGKVVDWNNNSGHYKPPATLNGGAGLPLDKFNGSNGR